SPAAPVAAPDGAPNAAPDGCSLHTAPASCGTPMTGRPSRSTANTGRPAGLTTTSPPWTCNPMGRPGVGDEAKKSAFTPPTTAAGPPPPAEAALPAKGAPIANAPLLPGKPAAFRRSAWVSTD